MTLLVGIRCTDGVVVAADSASTFVGGSGEHTITHPVRKIDIVAGKVIVAGTGAVGLGQRFHAVVHDLYEKKQLKGGHLDWVKKMATGTIADFSETHVRQGQFGALVAFANKRSGHLCEFAIADFQPEMKEDKCWYVSMGSGQSLADPYLALMRLTFWRDGPPNLQGGTFAAAWVMRHAIEVAPGLIALPISIAVLSGDGDARLLEEDELEEHLNLADASLDHFADFAKRLSDTENAPDVPVSGDAPAPESS